MPWAGSFGVPERPRRRAAFTLVELVLVVVILGLLSAAVVLPRIGSLRSKADESGEQAVVSAVRAGIQTARMRRVAEGTGTYPDTLDAAATRSAGPQNPLFADVVPGGVTDGRWKKVGPRSYVCEPSGRQYNYDARTGEFSPTARASAAPRARGTLAAGSAPPVQKPPQPSQPGNPGTGTNPPALTRQQVQRLTPDQIASAHLTSQQTGWLTYRQYAQLSAKQLSQLSDTQKTVLANKGRSLTQQQLSGLSAPMLALMAPSLTAKQVAGLSYKQFEEVVHKLSAAQIAAARPEQIAMLSDEAYRKLSAAQKAALTARQRAERKLADWVRSLKYRQFPSLSPEQIRYLTPQQIATIPNEWWLARIPEASRHALTARQIQALRVDRTGIGLLSAQQRTYLLTSQVQKLRYTQFQYLPASRIAELTPVQIKNIPNEWWLARIPPEARGRLTRRQVQALRVDRTGIGLLTAQQRTYLTTPQVQKLRYSQFRYLPADRVVELTPQQIGQIPNDWWLARFSAEARAKLTQQQVQALQVDRTGIGLLTAQQRTYLTTPQVQKLRYSQFRYLPADRVVELTPQQIGQIPNDWWLARFSAEARAKLTQQQVQALQVDRTGIGLLTAQQRTYLTTPQVQKLRYSQFRYLPADRVVELTPQQIGQIPNDWWFTRFSSEAIAALTAEQVAALRPDVYDRVKHLLTADQIAMRP